MATPLGASSPSAAIDWSKFGLVVSVPPRLSPDRPTDIAEVLRARLPLDADREALVGRHARYSFGELDRVIDAAAGGLAAWGVRRGDRVAATAKNDPDIVIAFHAVQRLGAVWVGIARQLSPSEKAYQLRDCEVSLYLVDRAAAAEIESRRADLPALSRIVDMEPSRGDSEWRRMLKAHASQRLPLLAVDPFAPAAIGYTSGTTGLPKGVVHSQHNLIVATNSLEAPGVARQGCVMQLTVLNVMANHGIGVLAAGKTLICVDRSDANGILEWVEAENIDGLRAPPPVVYDMLTRPELASFDLSRLVYLATAGGFASAKLRDLYEARLGRPMLDGYGLTEAPGLVTHFQPDDRPCEHAIGRPVPHLEVGILDQQGHEMPADAAGEICLRAARVGPSAGLYTPMLGYWRQPDATAAALRGGWLHTGDIGYRDTNGMFFISARSHDMILRGGANVYPREIERVIAADPRVREVIAFGIPDERLGQIVAAAIEIEDGVDPVLLKADLVTAAEERLARYKRPVVWMLDTSLPRNAMGKLERKKIRRMMDRENPPTDRARREDQP